MRLVCTNSALITNAAYTYYQRDSNQTKTDLPKRSRSTSEAILVLAKDIDAQTSPSPISTIHNSQIKRKKKDFCICKPMGNLIVYSHLLLSCDENPLVRIRIRRYVRGRDLYIQCTAGGAPTPQPPLPPSPMSDSELRQRQPSPATSTKAPPKGKENFSSPPPSNKPPAATVTRGIILVASLALSVIALLYLRNFHSSSPATSYILCSPPGARHIYTVDHDDSKAECMTVSEHFILDTGTHGKSHEPINPFKTPFVAHFPSRPHKPVFIIQIDLHQARRNCRSRTDR
jgi:hypothetical protein